MTIKELLIVFLVLFVLFIFDTSAVDDDAHPQKTSKDKKKRSLHMSKIAKAHLSDDNNPNNYPRLLGIEFEGCRVHPLIEQSSDFIKLVASYGTEADSTTIQELAQGFDALRACSPEESFEIFDAIIQHFPDSIFAYIGRGISLGRLANKIKASSESAMKDFDHVMSLKSHFYLVYRCRAEVHFLTGKYEDALKDAEKDLQYKHDGSAYIMAGIISYKMEKDFQATEYLKIGQKFINGHNAVSYEYLGMAYLNMGMLRKAIDALKTSLEFDSENLKIIQTLGTTYNAIGDSENAHYYLDLALNLDPENPKTLETKGDVYFQSGQPKEAIHFYKSCIRLDPTSTGCMFMKSVAFASVGQFFNAVKAMTKVMLSGGCNQDYGEPLYLRDFYRYLNRKLDEPLKNYRFDEDLPENYRNLWAKKVFSNYFNYTEQPGIEPHMIDVEDFQFSELSNNTKVLLCKANQLAPYFQYRVDGFMENKRNNIAMALAAIDVGQTIKNYWSYPKSTKGWKGRIYSWRDLIEVAVKWRKLVSMDQPVIWLSELPKHIVDVGFTTHMLLKKGNVEMPRYSTYTLEALQLAKFMIRSLLGQKLPAKAQDNVMKAVAPIDILNVLKKYDSANPNGGFTVGMQVPSTRNKGGLLHGVMLSITGETESDATLSIQSSRTSLQINQYIAEFNHLFNELKLAVLKNKTDTDNDLAVDIVLKFIYYFYNLLPLSRGTSAVAYSVAVGLFLGVNKEITSFIPKEKQPDIESYFSGSPDAFVKKMRTWMTFKNSNPPITSYPSVSETFSTSRTIIEALNVDVTEKMCRTFLLES
ncbi:tetratricopeptide repeat protein 13 isoform X1 [Hydra vulgaris]|uniref:tetratricopeptide repeat protein 13 isoform X1 n=2 Tax=Hydra vulgaris TaxID=6087 RepID=UPI001F5FA70B|nr:tetratricopeptide repeat protein 13 isoform X1 [Hydra vulgaris]